MTRWGEAPMRPRNVRNAADVLTSLITLGCCVADPRPLMRHF
jgi:hypothetical protein